MKYQKKQWEGKPGKLEKTLKTALSIGKNDRDLVRSA